MRACAIAIALLANPLEHIGVSADSGGLYESRDVALQRAKDRAFCSLRALCASFDGEVAFPEQSCHLAPAADGRMLWSCSVSATVTCALCSPEDPPRA